MSPKKLNLKDKYKLLTRDLDWNSLMRIGKRRFLTKSLKG